MIQTIFYLLGTIALMFHIIEKTIEWLLDVKELKTAFRLRRSLKKGKR